MIITNLSITDAFAVAEPKHVVLTDDTATVYTGDDIPPLATVTLEVSAWQLRKALNQTGMRAQIEAFVAASADQDLKDGWEYAQFFQEDHPFIAQAALLLGLSDAEVKGVFELAAAL
jgi:hypothetical protein